MKKIRSILSRNRLMTNVLALALLLGVLAVTPAKGDIVPLNDMTCYTGCVNWTKQDGCLECTHCCSWDDGSWRCWEEDPSHCA